MLLSVVAIVAVGVTITLGWLKGRKIKPLPTLIGVVVYAVLLFSLVLISEVLWARVLAANPATTGVAFQDFHDSGWAILGFLLVTEIIFVVLMSLLARYTRVPSLTAGAMIAWLAFGFYLFGPATYDFGNPLMIEFTSWSLLAGAGGLVVATFSTAPLQMLILLILCSIPIIFMFAPLIEFSMLKPIDKAKAPVLLLIYAIGLLMLQILFSTGQGELDSSKT
ncbi:MAG: hypothetical protein C3F13_13700 [Anaerolineales bacterium]|nr:MAG: hypothetical protein C3F13_13700 [Anaerolineales bacterium]